MAKNVLDLLMWHPKWDIKRCRISYIHRGLRGTSKQFRGQILKGSKGASLC